MTFMLHKGYVFYAFPAYVQTVSCKTVCDEKGKLEGKERCSSLYRECPEKDRGKPPKQDQEE